MSEHKNKKKETSKTLDNQDHLMNFIKDTEKSVTNIQNSIEEFGSNSRQKVDKIELNSDWQDVPLKDLPYGKFYPIGAHVFVKPTSTKEIQAFAIVNEENPYDVQLKLNELLSTCSKIVYMDGSEGTYKQLQDGDRDTLTIIISKISAKNGRKIEKSVSCDCMPGNDEQKVELIPANYVYKTENEDIAPYFDQESKVYIFKIELDGTMLDVKLAPPTIGLTEDINNYIFYQTTKSQGTILPNITFMQTIPYMKAGKGIKTLDIEALEQEEYQFTKINPELFTFIYDALDLMDFGVTSVKKGCSKCGKEMATPFTFPNGPRALFIVPNAFKQYIR